MPRPRRARRRRGPSRRRRRRRPPRRRRPSAPGAFRPTSSMPRATASSRRSACERPERAPPAFAWAGLAAATALASPSAHALTKDQCVDANTSAQSLRREGKFGAAREQLTLCIDSRCPGIVRYDCTQRLDELERAQPTIVFDAKNVAGDDVVLVHVTVDGGGSRRHPRRPRSGGRSGPPRVHVRDAPGQPATTYRLVLKEGEKDRRERIVLGAPAEPSPVRRRCRARGDGRFTRRRTAGRRARPRRRGPGGARGGRGLRRVDPPRLVQLAERVRKPHQVLELR